MSEDVIIEIIKWYKDPKNYNAGQITEFVNDYLTRMNRQNISRSSVEKIISQPYVKNACMISRHGDVYAENKLLPFARFKKPEAEGILWCMDGSKFQFAYKLGNSKFNYLTYFIIIDGCSDKIIGYSNDDSENHVMVIDAFEKACLTTGYLPREIIADDSPAYRAKEFTQIVSHIKNWGVNYRQIMRNNPRDNSYAERFFGVLQESYCKKIDGYIGDGIKSKNQNGRPAPEELKKFCSLKKIRTKQELIEIIESTLLKYNIDKDKKKRNENDYTNGKKKKFQPIQLNTIKYVQLFWNQNELTIHNSSITFDINKVNYCYNIYDGEKVKKHNGIKVLVRYNKADLSKIMIFNLKYDTYITTLDRLPTISKGSYERDSEQNSNLYRHSKRKKELKSKLLEGMKKIDEISQKNRESLPPELTEFTSVSKYQKEATENSILNEEMNKLLGAVNFKRIENNKEGDDSKNIYKQKGNLKRFTYGNN